MVITIIILSLISILSISFSLFLFRALSKSFKVLSSYEKIYNDTADDIQAILEFVDALRKRDLLVEDPDVLKFYKVTEYMHNTLSQYVNDMGGLRGSQQGDGEKQS